MRKIYSFKEYNRVNETQDMMFMPVDPIKGTPELYGNILQELKNVCGSAYNKVMKTLEQMFLSATSMTSEAVEEALLSAEKYFGKDPKSLTFNDIKRKLQREFEVEPFMEAEIRKSPKYEPISKKIWQLIKKVFSNKIVIGIGSIIAGITALASVWVAVGEFGDLGEQTGAVGMTFGGMVLIFFMYKLLETSANIKRLNDEQRNLRNRM
jgi:hypothetical protein